jgi:AAA domain
MKGDRVEVVVASPSRTRCFVVMSGLPASGKSTLGRELGQALGLSVIDKDTVLKNFSIPSQPMTPSTETNSAGTPTRSSRPRFKPRKEQSSFRFGGEWSIRQLAGHQPSGLGILATLSKSTARAIRPSPQIASLHALAIVATVTT